MSEEVPRKGLLTVRDVIAQIPAKWMDARMAIAYTDDIAMPIESVQLVRNSDGERVVVISKGRLRIREVASSGK